MAGQKRGCRKREVEKERLRFSVVALCFQNGFLLELDSLHLCFQDTRTTETKHIRELGSIKMEFFESIICLNIDLWYGCFHFVELKFSLARTGIEPATLALLAPRSNQLS